jgi:hypothetical protein
VYGCVYGVACTPTLLLQEHDNQVLEMVSPYIAAQGNGVFSS